MNKFYADNFWLLKNFSSIKARKLYDNRHIIDWKFASKHFCFLIEEEWLNKEETDSLYYYIDWYQYSLKGPKMSYKFILENFDNFYWPRLRDNMCNRRITERYAEQFKSMYKNDKLGHNKLHRYLTPAQERINANIAVFEDYIEEINNLIIESEVAMSFSELHKLNDRLLTILNTPLIKGTSIYRDNYNKISDIIDIKYNITYISDDTKRYKISIIQ